MRWLFPGKEVRIDSHCLDCGEPMQVRMRDEEILGVEPDTLVGYTVYKLGAPVKTPAFR